MQGLLSRTKIYPQRAFKPNRAWKKLSSEGIENTECDRHFHCTVQESNRMHNEHVHSSACIMLFLLLYLSVSISLRVSLSLSLSLNNSSSPANFSFYVHISLNFCTSCNLFFSIRLSISSVFGYSNYFLEASISFRFDLESNQWGRDRLQEFESLRLWK